MKRSSALNSTKRHILDELHRSWRFEEAPWEISTVALNSLPHKNKFHPYPFTLNFAFALVYIWWKLYKGHVATQLSSERNIILIWSYGANHKANICEDHLSQYVPQRALSSSKQHLLVIPRLKDNQLGSTRMRAFLALALAQAWQNTLLLEIRAFHVARSLPSAIPGGAETPRDVPNTIMSLGEPYTYIAHRLLDWTKFSI